jgi:hypothetical protein
MLFPLAVKSGHANGLAQHVIGSIGFEKLDIVTGNVAGNTKDDTLESYLTNVGSGIGSVEYGHFIIKQNGINGNMLVVVIIIVGGDGIGHVLGNFAYRLLAVGCWYTRMTRPLQEMNQNLAAGIDILDHEYTSFGWLLVASFIWQRRGGAFQTLLLGVLLVLLVL